MTEAWDRLSRRVSAVFRTTRISPGLMSPSSARATFSIVGASCRSRWIVSASVAFWYCSRDSSATAALNSRRARNVSDSPRSPMSAFTASTHAAKQSTRPVHACSRRRGGSFGVSNPLWLIVVKGTVPNPPKKYKRNFVQAPRSVSARSKYRSARESTSASFTHGRDFDRDAPRGCRSARGTVMMRVLPEARRGSSVGRAQH